MKRWLLDCLISMTLTVATGMLWAAPSVGCPGTLDPRLVVGLQGKVIARTGIVLRGGPGFTYDEYGTLVAGEPFDVIGGPGCADSTIWWQIAVEGRAGWLAESLDNRYLVEPIVGISNNPPIYYISDSQGIPALFRANTDGTGWRFQAVVYGAFEAQVSPDGLHIGITTPYSIDLYSRSTDARIAPGTSRIFDGSPSQARWSPDFGHVVFGLYEVDQYELYLQSVGTTEAIQLTHEAGDVTGAVWSPDGTQIAYAVSRPDGGSHLKLIAPDETEGQTIYESEVFIRSLDWSPDGAKIAFDEGDNLHIIDVATQVLTTYNIPESLVFEPLWSPDGTQILYQVLPLGTVAHDLYTVAADGSTAPTFLVRNAGTSEGGSPARAVWSPDSQQLAYSTTAGKMYLVSADGTDNKVLITDREYAWPVAWLANPPLP